MFDKGMVNSLKTVGTLIKFHETLAFMIGPDNTGKKLGIVRFGGHIEEGESAIQALNREIIEECSIRVDLLNSPNTFYKKDWNDSELIDISNEVNYDIMPLLLKGNYNRLSALFLSKTDVVPIPSSETTGIIFLRRKDIMDICTHKITCLSEFLDNGGKIIKQNEMDLNMEMYAGVHLKFIYDLLLLNNSLIVNFIEGNI